MLRPFMVNFQLAIFTNNEHPPEMRFSKKSLEK
jgi:hypothetical protein